jgi:hypothetical protein
MENFHGKFEEKKQQFQTISEQYTLFKSLSLTCEPCDELLIQKIEESTHKEIKEKLYDKKFLKSLYNQETVVETLKKAKEDEKISLKMKNYITDESNLRIKSGSSKTGEELDKQILNELFLHWKNETKHFSVLEIDKLIQFNENEKDNAKKEIFKLIKERNIQNVDFSELFPQAEKNLSLLKEYFESNTAGNGLIHLDWFRRNLKLKDSMRELNSELDRIQVLLVDK